MFTNTVYTDFFLIIEKATENPFSKIYKIYWILLLSITMGSVGLCKIHSNTVLIGLFFFETKPVSKST